jgi:hypothetical protein
MRNDTSRQWAMLTPLVPGEVLTAQAQQAEAAGLAGIFIPEIYSSPFMGPGYCAAVTERAEARNDARATVAFYAGMRQYEPMFAAMGFGKQARACSRRSSTRT